MKHLGFSKFAAATVLAVGMMGCAEQDMNLDGYVDGPVTFSVELPASFTRSPFQTSFGLGESAKSLKCYVYSVRGTADAPVYKQVEVVTGNLNGKEGNVQLDLAKGVNYRLVFWASADDKATANEDECPYEITAEGKLQLKSGQVQANDDNFDAFYTAIDYQGGKEYNSKLSLSRPFAQINFGTDDAQYDPSYTDIFKHAYPNGAYTQISAQGYPTLNLLTGQVEGDPVTYTSAITSIEPLEALTFPVPASDASKTNHYTNMMYVIAPGGDAQMTSDLVFQTFASETSTTAIHTVSVPTAPVKANYRTNVYGSLLTSKTDFTVSIDKAFATEMHNIGELQMAINSNTNSGSFKLIEDMAGETLTLPASETTKTVDLDLAGKKMPNIVVERNQTLNINDATGTLQEAGAATRAGGVTLITVKAGATVNILDGYFACSGDNKIVEVEPGGILVIHGGSYRGQIEVLSEYLAPGLKFVEGEYGRMEVKDGPMSVATAEQFLQAVAKANTTPDFTIIMTESIALPANTVVTLGGIGTTLTMNAGKTLTLGANSYINIKAGDYPTETTLTNCNIVSTGDVEAMIKVSTGSTTISGGSFEAQNTCILNNATITITDGGTFYSHGTRGGYAVESSASSNQTSFSAKDCYGDVGGLKLMGGYCTVSGGGRFFVTPGATGVGLYVGPEASGQVTAGPMFFALTTATKGIISESPYFEFQRSLHSVMDNSLKLGVVSDIFTGTKKCMWMPIAPIDIKDIVTPEGCKDLAYKII